MSTPHVQFEEADIHRVTTESGGIYALRERSNTGVGSIAPTLTKTKTNESGAPFSGPDLEEGEIKTAQIFTGWKLLWLAYQSTGVIYGDIGTSPLYVYSSTFTKDPSHDDLLGALSLIIWTLTLMVSVKYVLIVLRADDEGEGGTFALFSLLSRYANIVRRDPRDEQKIKMQRAKTMDLGLPAQKTRNFMEKSRFMKWLLRSIGVVGVSLVMADGVLTPAQSVLGAIQGIEVVTPGISNSTIVGVSCGIIILLFAIQPFGTTKLATAFAPIVIIWLIFNFIFGIYNLAIHDWTVLKAFSPYFAGNYLVRNGTEGWKSLGGILLAFTGCEALFADLGAFTRTAVQLSWLSFAFPCLLLSYIGQAAYISEKPAAWTNPFFNTVPPGMLYPSLVIAILAAVVASQAIITAVFQLLSQTMTLSYFPQIKLVHTSKIFYGQIYIPFANWLLMIGCVIITAVYNNTTRLGHAYGVCVILVTFITTNMVALVALIVWQLPSFVVVPVWLVFACLDGLYLSSALTKVPSGAWFTLVLSIVLSSMFMLWRYGKEQQWKAEAADKFHVSHILTVDESSLSDDTDSGVLKMTQAFGSHRVSRIDGIGIFFDKSGNASTTPTVFVNFLQKFHAAPEVIIFFHLRSLQIPSIPPENRYRVSRCSLGQGRVVPNCFRVTIKHGYTDQVMMQELDRHLYEQVRDFIIKEAASPRHRAPRVAVIDQVEPRTDGNEHERTSDISPDWSEKQESNPTATTGPISSPAAASSRATSPGATQANLALSLDRLERAFNAQTVYVVGKQRMRIRSTPPLLLPRSLAGLKSGVGGWVRNGVLGVFLYMRNSTRGKIETLKVDGERLVEVGVVKEI